MGKPVLGQLPNTHKTVAGRTHGELWQLLSLVSYWSTFLHFDIFFASPEANFYWKPVCGKLCVFQWEEPLWQKISPRPCGHTALFFVIPSLFKIFKSTRIKRRKNGLVLKCFSKLTWEPIFLCFTNWPSFGLFIKHNVPFISEKSVPGSQLSSSVNHHKMNSI